MRFKLFFLSIVFLLAFSVFSYTVAKETYTKFDFDATVKLQDRTPRIFDELFSYFSLLGSFEVTVGFCIILAVLLLFRGKFFGFIGWFMIVPATIAEIYGKLVLFHPGPPVLFHRSLLPTSLPSFYVHTDFSYPSGHMTRTIFIATILAVLILTSRRSFTSKFIFISGLATLAFAMGVTRVLLGEHWTTDVVGGILLGVGMGFLASVLIFHKKRL